MIIQPHSLTVDGVEIQTPSANRHHAAPAGGLQIAGEAGGNVVRVHVKIERRAYTIPATPNDGGWTVGDVTNGRFTIDNVPGAVTTAITGSDDNKAIAFPELSTGGFGVRDVAYFIGRPVQEMLVVRGQDCMWFAFADTGQPGPGPMADTEADTANHKPPSLITPTNAATASVQAGGTWRHFTANAESDADGRDPAVGLELAGYQAGQYRSESIEILTTLVNKLIGMWVDSSNAPIGSPFAIGKGPTVLSIPADADRLFLAHHDGKRWHNNGGQVDVTIDWTVPVGFMRLRPSQRQRPASKQYEVEGAFRLKITENG